MNCGSQVGCVNRQGKCVLLRCVDHFASGLSPACFVTADDVKIIEGNRTDAPPVCHN